MYKIKEGFLLRTVAGSNIVVPVGSIDFSGVITLNEVGALIWKKLENGAELDELVDAVLEEYDTDRETALADIEGYIEELKGRGMLE